MNKQIQEFFNEPITNAISECINERVFSYTFTNYNASSINRLIKDGILMDNRTLEMPTHKYSLIDIIWINTVETLKCFGMHKKQIRRIKEQLLINSNELPILYPYLEYHLINTALYDTPYTIVIDENCELTITSQEKQIYSQAQPSLIISINELFKRVINQIDRTNKYFEDLFCYSKVELELLVTVKQGDFKLIEITQKDGKVATFNNSGEKAKMAILNILNEGNYRQIDITQNDNRIRSIHTTVKRK